MAAWRDILPRCQLVAVGRYPARRTAAARVSAAVTHLFPPHTVGRATRFPGRLAGGERLGPVPMKNKRRRVSNSTGAVAVVIQSFGNVTWRQLLIGIAIIVVLILVFWKLFSR